MFVYQNVNPAEQFCPVYYEIKTWICTRKTYISKIQLVVYYQCCILIGWATTRLYVIAH